MNNEDNIKFKIKLNERVQEINKLPLSYVINNFGELQNELYSINSIILHLDKNNQHDKSI